MPTLASVFSCCLLGCVAFAQDTAPEPRNVAPRTAKDPAVADAMRRMEAMVGKGADGGALLAAKDLSPLREVTEFRRVVRDRAPLREVKMVAEGEPGTPLTVRGVVVDRQGKPVAGGLVYAYHTDQRGWYADRAPHFTGDGGDFAHARLFAWVKTDDQGAFVLHTIRPAGYPRSTLPEHIHWQVFAGERSLGIGEIWFDDDARLTPAMRARAGRDVVVCKPKQEGATVVVAPKLVVDAPPPAK